MHIHEPSPPAFYLQHNGTALAGSETVLGEDALAARLRDTARLYRFPCWEHGLREIIIALLTTNGLVIFDADGVRLAWDDLRLVLDASWAACRARRALARDFEYRNGPVPLTGRYRRGGRYRAPRTRNAMIAEASAAACEVEALTPRFQHAVSRREKHVTAWDDIPRSDDRNWKRQRATRWR